MMGTEAVGLLHEGERVIGVRAREHHGSGDKPDMTFNADLVVACDGRHSTLRKCAGLAVEDLGTPMDVLWFRLSRKPTDTDENGGRFDAGSVFVTLQPRRLLAVRVRHRQGKIRGRESGGLDAFRERLGKVLPFEAARASEITDWDQVKLLTVAVDRLKQWHRPGLLVIGMLARHVPVGGHRHISRSRTPWRRQIFSPAHSVTAGLTGSLEGDRGNSTLSEPFDAGDANHGAESRHRTCIECGGTIRRGRQHDAAADHAAFECIVVAARSPRVSSGSEFGPNTSLRNCAKRSSSNHRRRHTTPFAGGGTEACTLSRFMCRSR